MKLKLKKLRASKHEKMLEVLNAIAEAGRAPTPEENKQLTDLETEIVGLDVAIEKASKAEEREQQLAGQIDKPSDPPAPQQTATGNTDQQDTAAGNRPHVQGAVLGQKAENEFATLGEFLQVAVASSRQGAPMDQRLARMQAQRIQQAAGDTRILQDGGFLVPQQFGNELFTASWQAGQITSRITPIPITIGNTYHYLEADDKDASTGSIASGIQFYWMDEADEIAESAPKFAEKQLGLKEAGTLVWASDNMLEDGPAFEAYVRAKVPLQQGFQLDKAVLFGAGTSGPQGMLHSSNKGRILIPKETQTPKIVTENVQKMYAAFPEWLFDKAVWVCQYKAKEILPTLNNAAGDLNELVYMPPGGLATRPHATIFGIPVLFHVSAKALGSEGDLALIAPSEYNLIQKGGMKVDVSIHVEFKKGKTVIRFRFRLNGKPSWHLPLKVENGGHQLSPYVVLAGGR